MAFPLSLWDLSLWLAITALILLITMEVLSPQYGRIRILIDRKKLKNGGLTVSALFLITITIKIITMILTP